MTYDILHYFRIYSLWGLHWRIHPVTVAPYFNWIDVAYCLIRFVQLFRMNHSTMPMFPCLLIWTLFMPFVILIRPPVASNEAVFPFTEVIIVDGKDSVLVELTLDAVIWFVVRFIVPIVSDCCHCVWVDDVNFNTFPVIAPYVGYVLPFMIADDAVSDGIITFPVIQSLATTTTTTLGTTLIALLSMHHLVLEIQRSPMNRKLDQH